MLNDVLPSTIVVTRYAGPTNHHGSRVIVRNVNTGKWRAFTWDPALGSLENHAMAAALFGSQSGVLAKIVTYSGVNGGGYMFVISPPRQ